MAAPKKAGAAAVAPAAPTSFTEDVACRVSPEQKERLRRAAAELDRSESWLVRAAINDWLNRHEGLVK